MRGISPYCSRGVDGTLVCMQNQNAPKERRRRHSEKPWSKLVLSESPFCPLPLEGCSQTMKTPLGKALKSVERYCCPSVRVWTAASPNDPLHRSFGAHTPPKNQRFEKGVGRKGLTTDKAKSVEERVPQNNLFQMYPPS